MLKEILVASIVGVAVGVMVPALGRLLRRSTAWAISWSVHLGRRYHPTNRQLREIESMCWAVQKNPGLIDESSVIDPWGSR